ncbi:hypothetical protein I6F66_22205 [Pseudoalteromonas sp. NZS100_1]|nr:hypothetical protein [Pseudoalteromonas sp. NZS100_1]
MFVSNLINADTLHKLAEDMQDLSASEAYRELLVFMEENSTETGFSARQTSKGWEISFNRTIITDDVTAFANVITSVAGIDWN